MLSTDAFFGTHFEPWDCHELPLFLLEDESVFSPDLTQEPLFSNSGSDNSEPIHISSNSGSNEENRKRKPSNSGSADPSVVDDRKRRRMISNRESAQRSRMRKQKHLEDLRIQLNRLKVENRDMMNRLLAVVHHSQILQTQNELLRSESVMLQQKQWDMQQDLVVRQLE